jgi:hypothetical protein
LWLDSEYTKIPYFSYALDWTDMKWVLKNLCLTDMYGAKITMEDYFKAHTKNLYSFWPKGAVPMLTLTRHNFEEQHLDPLDWKRLQANASGEVEPVVTTPAKKTSGSTRTLYKDVSSPTIKTSLTVSPHGDVKLPAFPHAEASATNKTNAVDSLGGIPVNYMDVSPVTSGSTPSAVLPAAQKGMTPSVAQCLPLSQEDTLEDSDDGVQPTTKKGRKSSHWGTK